MTTAPNPQVAYELALASNDLPALQTAAREYLPALSPLADRDTWAEVAGVVRVLEAVAS
jgi:hypothetical protein